MEPLELKRLIERVEGRWVAAERPPEIRVAELETDTRTLNGHGLFVALRGERQDGHAFVEEARRRGAVASIVSSGRVPELPRGGGPYIAVDDPLAALERLASWNRAHLDVSVVGVTGSVGKTSTKEFLGAVLADRFQVKAAPKSFNNRLGVALTLLSASPRTEVLVVELATSGRGELSHLSRIVRPERVVLTEIAPAHLKGLGDLDGVVAAKAEVLDGLLPGGKLFIRDGIYGFDHFCSRTSGPVVTFGWRSGTDRTPPDYAVSNCEHVFLGGDAGPGKSRTTYGYHFTINDRENFLLPVPGRHNVLNAAAVVAVARDLGMSWEEIRASLSLCRLPPGRLEVVEEGGVVFFDDTYNASPRSVQAAFEEWRSLASHLNGSRAPRNGVGGTSTSTASGSPGERVSGNGASTAASRSSMVAVLGDMLELGADSRRLHEEVGTLLAGCDARIVVTVGEESRWIQDGYQKGGGRARTEHFASASEALPFLKDVLRDGDRVLFKGSRRIGLDRTVRSLRRWLSGEEVPSSA